MDNLMKAACATAGKKKKSRKKPLEKMEQRGMGNSCEDLICYAINVGRGNDE